MITTFQNYLLHNRGLSTATVESYGQNLHTFARWINIHYTGTRWSTITKAMIDDYVEYLVVNKYKPASIKQAISTLRTFYKTALAMGAQIDNPARYVSTPKLGEHLPKTIEKEAIKKALESPYTNKTAKAVIAIVFETGIRLQELLDLRPGDVNRESRSITIKGKGNKERVVYYGELTHQYGAAIFQRSWNQREIRRLVFDALKPYSTAGQLSPHAIRHTYASMLIDNGMSIDGIRKLLGHEHTATTEIYAQMSNQKARELYLQFAPTLN